MKLHHITSRRPAAKAGCRGAPHVNWSWTFQRENVADSRIAASPTPGRVETQSSCLQGQGGWQTLKLAYLSIGAVYGDLGTSPLYVYPNVFSSQPTAEQVLGVMSLIFWTLTLIMLVKMLWSGTDAYPAGTGWHSALQLCSSGQAGTLHAVVTMSAAWFAGQVHWNRPVRK